VSRTRTPTVPYLELVYSVQRTPEERAVHGGKVLIEHCNLIRYFEEEVSKARESTRLSSSRLIRTCINCLFRLAGIARVHGATHPAMTNVEAFLIDIYTNSVTLT